MEKPTTKKKIKSSKEGVKEVFEVKYNLHGGLISLNGKMNPVRGVDYELDGNVLILPPLKSKSKIK